MGLPPPAHQYAITGWKPHLERRFSSPYLTFQWMSGTRHQKKPKNPRSEEHPYACKNQLRTLGERRQACVQEATPGMGRRPPPRIKTKAGWKPLEGFQPALLLTGSMSAL